MKDALGDRMKSFYEDRTRILLPRRTYTIIRVDGKAFHTYTRGLKRPFDQGLIEDMNETAAFLCKNIQGAKLAYVQSDEISILLTDFDSISTDMWFDGNIQKMTSISASLATARFNELRMIRYFSVNWDNIAVENDKTIGEHFEPGTDLQQVSDDIASFINYLPINRKLAMFDARVFQIPQSVEVENYFIWRQQDATRNSISSVAQSLYSPKELHGKKTDEMQEMIFQKGINWNDYSFREKRGGVIAKVEEEIKASQMGFKKSGKGMQQETVKRNRWKLVETPIFTQDRNFLKNLIPHQISEE